VTKELGCIGTGKPRFEENYGLFSKSPSPPHGLGLGRLPAAVLQPQVNRAERAVLSELSLCKYLYDKEVTGRESA
jgi:hypothetical protein